MPWCLPDPDRGAPRGAFDCQSCLASASPATRAMLHCGWMDESEWKGTLEPPPVGPDPYDVDVCPGWLVRQPAVKDGADAYAALEAHALDIYDPDRLNVIWSMAMEAKRAMNLYSAARQRQIAGRQGFPPREPRSER